MKSLASYMTYTLRKWNLQILVIAVALGMVICCSNTLAQSGAGSIQGTVTDSAGAVMPRASVHVVNQGTGQSVSTETNGTGFYSVPSLFAGNYTVTYTAKGMKAYEVSISLLAAQTAEINPSLSVGSANETVTVSGNVIQLVTTDAPTISSDLDNSRINQLPMNGRSITFLAGETTPGLESSGTRANGNMPAGLEYVQDGAPLSNRNTGGATRMPDPDAVQEVRVETADSSAEFVEPATGIVTTKAGTNQLHGTSFETARNNYIGIAKARQNPSNFAAPHLVRNEFGSSVGGPIVMPKLYNGKDKSFFFFAYERYSNRSNVSEQVTVPTLAMEGGDFSGLNNSSGVLQVLYDSQTSNPVTYERTPFPGNKIPLSRLSPFAKALYSITPQPTNTANPEIASNFTANGISNQTLPTITFRLDHDFNQNNRVYLRYTSDNYTTLALENYPINAASTIAGSGFPAGAAGLAVSPTTVYSTALGYAHIFSPTFFSETVLSNEWELDYAGAGGNPNLNYESLLGLPNNFGEVGFPQIGDINGSSLFMNYSSSQFAYKGSQILTNLDENLTKTLGRHQLIFGGRYRHERLGIAPDQRRDNVGWSAQGAGEIDPTTGTSYGQLANTGNPNADFFLGAASVYTVNLDMGYLHFRDQEFDSYFQDNFHVNRRLTVNLGVRWEILPAGTEHNFTTNGFDFTNKAIVLGQPTSQLIARGVTTQAIITNLQNLGVKFETPQQAGLPNSMLFGNDFSFSPRLGLAYTPFGNKLGTVLRGGFGRYIYPIPLRSYYSTQSTNAPYQFAYSQSYISASQSPDGLANYLLRTPQSVVAGQNSTNVVNTGGTTSILPGITELVLNPHYSPNYVSQANVTIEQPIKWNSVLRVTYLYDHGTNLDQYDELQTQPSGYAYDTTTGQQPPSGTYSAVALGPYDQTTYGAIDESDRNGISNDNSLQLNYQRLYKKGYAFQAFYVYSRAFRMGGNSQRDAVIYPIADYAPGFAPVSTTNVLPWTTPKALNRFQNYEIDSAIPEHHVSFNGILDLPVGRGKRFLGNSNRFVDELIGGYQVAGDGNILSQWFQPAAANWGQTSPIHIYKHGLPITDCRSGVCYPEYLWFNGYIAPTANANIDCTTKCVSGLPTNYVPYEAPINNTPATPTVPQPNYGNNNVPIRLTNGNTVNVAYNPGPGLNPFAKTHLSGPFNYTVDLSVFKVFPITERVNLRANVDAFNALNVQGFINPNTTDGTESLLTSNNTARQVQFTLRLTF